MDLHIFGTIQWGSFLLATPEGESLIVPAGSLNYHQGLLTSGYPTFSLPYLKKNVQYCIDKIEEI